MDSLNQSGSVQEKDIYIYLLYIICLMYGILGFIVFQWYVLFFEVGQRSIFFFFENIFVFFLWYLLSF